MTIPTHVLIVCAEGSGSTAFKAAFDSMPGALVLGDLTYSSVFRADRDNAGRALRARDASEIPTLSTAARSILRLFSAERVMGSEQGTPAMGRRALVQYTKAVEHLIAVSRHRGIGVTHVISKFSQPYGSPLPVPADRPVRSRPEVLDLPAGKLLLDIIGGPRPFADSRLIVLRRDPRECAYSQLRRGFYANIRTAARWTEIGLNWICAQLRGLERPFLVVDRSDLGNHPRLARAVARHIDADAAALTAAFRHSDLKGPERPATWRRALGRHDRRFLEDFFSRDRLRQWDLVFRPKSLSRVTQRSRRF
jgi:hypothetical protein